MTDDVSRIRQELKDGKLCPENAISELRAIEWINQTALNAYGKAANAMLPGKEQQSRVPNKPCFYLDLSVSDAEHLYNALSHAVDIGCDWEHKVAEGKFKPPAELLASHKAEMQTWQKFRRLIRRRINRGVIG